MTGVIQGLVVGAAVGVVFALVRLSPPAPGNWAGVAGIVGIVAGWQAVSRLIE